MQVILVIEDNVRYYSSFLPIVYTEVIEHSQQLIPEGINVAHKILRMRARPKILLCTTYEEAWDYFTHLQPGGPGGDLGHRVPSWRGA